MADNNKLIHNLIEKYKEHIKTSKLVNELYKWELVQKYKERPNVSALDFSQEIKAISFSNLIYHYANVAAKNICSEYPEEYRECFRQLFDEEHLLNTRIKNFINAIRDIYKKMGQTLETHHDERTIATFLTYHNPEKYTFYKSSFYNHYCKYLGITSKSNGEKYIHYLQLIEELIENYISKDIELLSLIDNILLDSKYYPDKNRRILAQDILYQMFELLEINNNYWVFQANPKYYDTESALKAGILKTWMVSQHKKEIKVGDKVILWITGDKAGIYALATVNADIKKIKDFPEEVEFYIDKTDIDKEVDRVGLQIDFNLANSPILKEKILSNSILKSLKQGIQGTNLSATQEQYNEILNLIDMSFYNELKSFLVQSKTADLTYSKYLNKYHDLKVRVSFGQGGPAKVSWISFLRESQTTQKGIYPVYLYYKELDILVLAYGISETFKSNIDWDLQNPLTIEEYFAKNRLGKPFRYGKSFVYKSYDVKNLPNKEIIDKELIILLNYYKSIDINSDLNSEFKNQLKVSEKLNISSTFNDFINSGLSISDLLVERYASSLLTKPFVILTGLSGSGKTKLAQAFAMWLSTDKSQYKIVPVGADWTNREPLLGFPNALETGTYVKPDSGVLDLIIHATQNENKPYFLILDEMNLSHVERYFADFLSTMESGEEILLHAGDENWGDVPAKIKLPKNLFIVGTVNIDETTYMFSPKVLDRANVIEFRVTDKEMESYLGQSGKVDLEVLKGQGAAMEQSFVELARNRDLTYSIQPDMNKTLVSFFRELKKAGAEFGYRTAAEIQRFAAVTEALETEWTTEQILDVVIMQKLLPKLHGSRKKLVPVLETLIKLCIKPEAKAEDFYQYKEGEDSEKVLYPIALEKLQRMYRGLLDNGFSSYAEA